MKVTTREVKFRDPNGRMVSSLVIGNGSLHDEVTDYLDNNPEPVVTATESWLTENITQPTTPVVDASLSVSGAAADAKKTGDEISDLRSQIETIGSGLTDRLKQALMGLANAVGYKNDEIGATARQALYNALYTVEVTSITAVFNQGDNTIYDNNSLDDLKQYLTVTARYDNGTSETVSTYELSGTLEEGTCTITVSYSGKTATFDVTVVEYPWRTLVASDVTSHIGYTSYALNNGSVTASAVTTFSVLALASAITSFRFTPNLHYTHTEDNYTTVVFATDGSGGYYGTDGYVFYQFTISGTTKYTATEVSNVSTLTQTGTLNDSTAKTITLENGVLTFTGGNGSMTLTNATMIGLWGSKPNYVLPLNAEVNK